MTSVRSNNRCVQRVPALATEETAGCLRKSPAMQTT